MTKERLDFLKNTQQVAMMGNSMSQSFLRKTNSKSDWNYNKRLYSSNYSKSYLKTYNRKAEKKKLSNSPSQYYNQQINFNKLGQFPKYNY